jgi:hypothetical protein
MYRMTSWLSMTIVGAFLLSGLGGVALAPAILYSALASALLANLDNLPDYGSRGLYYARPLFINPTVWDMGFDTRTPRRRRDDRPYVSPSVVIPSGPRVVDTGFRPASSSSFGSISSSPSLSPVAKTFIPKKPRNEAPPPVLHSQASHHPTPPPGANPVASRFVPAGTSGHAPVPSSGPRLVGTKFRPA